MKRRQLLHTATAGSAAMFLPVGLAKAGEGFEGVLDSNISLFRWPFRRLPLDETTLLVEKLRSLHVTTAWAGSFECCFHRDLGEANAKLHRECETYPELIPVGTVDPSRRGWERDFETCISGLQMPGLRLFPNLHQYSIDHPAVKRLFLRAAESGTFLQVVVTLEDSRTQPEQIAAPDADLRKLPDLMKAVPDVRIQLLNLRPGVSQLAALKDLPGLFFDTARADSVDGVASLVAGTSPDRVVYGSHSPFLIPEAALIRVHESNLELEALRSVLRENSERMSP